MSLKSVKISASTKLFNSYNYVLISPKIKENSLYIVEGLCQWATQLRACVSVWLHTHQPINSVTVNKPVTAATKTPVCQISSLTFQNYSENSGNITFDHKESRNKSKKIEYQLSYLLVLKNKIETHNYILKCLILKTIMVST